MKSQASQKGFATQRDLPASSLFCSPGIAGQVGCMTECGFRAVPILGLVFFLRWGRFVRRLFCRLPGSTSARSPVSRYSIWIHPDQSLLGFRFCWNIRRNTPRISANSIHPQARLAPSCCRFSALWISLRRRAAGSVPQKTES